MGDKNDDKTVKSKGITERNPPRVSAKSRAKSAKKAEIIAKSGKNRDASGKFIKK
jgi:hypothetical protein